MPKGLSTAPHPWLIINQVLASPDGGVIWIQMDGQTDGKVDIRRGT